MVETKSEERSDICRDFLKNICNRGNRCKFYHPSDSPAANEKDQEVHFCIDFQNRGCHRDNCRFVHVPREEADRYKATKEFNLLLARAVAAVSTSDTINGIPVCKEFQTGKCSRGVNRCRYWHVNMEEERERRRRGLPPLGAGPPPLGAMGPGPRGRMDGRGPPQMGPPFGGPGPNSFPGFGGPMRRSLPHDDMGGFGDVKRPRMGGEMEMRMAEMEGRIADLTKENEALKREVQREHERYEDLYALFRQQAQGTGAMGVGGAALNPVQQQQQPMHAVPQQRQQQAAPYGSQMGGAMWGASAPQWSA
ncbi:hypothetical protein PMAYCL1PPCAC_14368 [Pristionchus mayeri]|uniref:C3H1-type domain-containing protein n=1 Tax=Pristionchus mayeri TaxID=1317129 RepID=A0AAN4ZSR7_9BILA|nr:hypothetical protein PMAYCL1PPCAC_14368 [Pristionchus mayeri]